MKLEAVPMFFIGCLLSRRLISNAYQWLSFSIPWTVLKRISCARGRRFVFALTFCCYAMFHACRKPLSVVKNVLVADCHRRKPTENASCVQGWPPFSDPTTSSGLLGALDSTFLFSYALAMFVAGHVAERSDLRLFLSSGMFLSGGATIAFGLAYFFQVHDLTFFLAVQMIGGAFQATGWPAVVAIMANWYGPANRGLIMGIWNSHTLVGNIMGSVIAAHFVNDRWGFSFVVPGALLMGLAVVVIVGLPSDSHQHAETQRQSTQRQRRPNYSSDDATSAVVSIEHPPSSSASSSSSSSSSEAISFVRALRIPGIVHYSFALFFAKFVSYSFLFWLPVFLKSTTSLDSKKAALFSTLFDMGGIVGGVIAGVASDRTGAAETSVVMMWTALPALHSLLKGFHGSDSVDLLPRNTTTAMLSSTLSTTSTPSAAAKTNLTSADVLVLIYCGFFIQGPKTIITTTVSAALGQHPSLEEGDDEENDVDEGLGATAFGGEDAIERQNVTNDSPASPPSSPRPFSSSNGSSRGRTKLPLKALSTVTAIIDGSGSLGAALGPLLTGVVLTTPYGWRGVIYMWIFCNFAASLPLFGVVRDGWRRRKNTEEKKPVEAKEEKE